MNDSHLIQNQSTHPHPQIQSYSYSDSQDSMTSPAQLAQLAPPVDLAPYQSRSSVYRHHRHPSNASETSSSSPFPEHLSVQLSASPAPSFEEPSTSFVEEPLPMEGEFATMDIHSPPSLVTSFLPSSSNHNPTFRYDTLTWAKEHPYPEPQDTILATGGLHPKTPISNLTAMLESASDSSNLPFQHHPPSSPNSFQQIAPSDHLDRSTRQDSLDQSNHSLLHSEPSGSLTTSINHPSVISSNPQIPTITTTSLSSNPTSPLLRLNMNHPAMPNGPSISLTSATPLTAKPDQQLEKFFESIGSLPNRSLNGLDSHTLGLSQSNDLYQHLSGTHPSEGTMQASHHLQQNSFFNPRPVRARQRSKSESMGKQFTNLASNDAIKQFVFGNPPTYPPSELSPPNQWDPSSSTATNSYYNSPQPSNFWAPIQTNQQSMPTSQVPPQISSQSPADDGRSQLMQQFLDSSYLLGGLFDQFNQKKELDLPNYDSSFLKPTPPLNHRRSHSVSHVHRRGRSEGGIAMGKPNNESAFESFLPIPNLSSSTATNPCLVSSQGHMNGMNSLGSQQNLVPADSNWPTSFPSEVGLDANYSHTLQHFTKSQAHSPVPSDACLSSQYSSRPRSFSHGSSFGSEETGGSGPPSTSVIPVELRSRTTAATKAAAVKRRKAGVAARYVCDMCGETFTRRYNLRGHQRAHKGEKPFECGYPGCTSRFARAHDQKRHYKLHLGVKDYSCPVCKKTFIRLDALQRHHKSDAGQACYQQLEQTRMRSSISEDFTIGESMNTNQPSDTNNHQGLFVHNNTFSNEEDDSKPSYLANSSDLDLGHSTSTNSTSMAGNSLSLNGSFFQM